MAEETHLASICSDVHAFAWRFPRHSFPFDSKKIPENGIYLLFEDGEVGHGGNRIVRVGTHAGEGLLPSRLAEHFVNPNKDRSIFRKNIGRALLAKDGDPFLAHWEIDLTTRRAKEKWINQIDKAKQAQVEARVSSYIQEHFSFVVFDVNEKGDRLFWESKIIGTVNQCNACGASRSWLGLKSPKDKIRVSGLWLVRGLDTAALTSTELDRLKNMQ